MRIAFVDLLFAWPPHGGADVDLYHIISGLQARGHTVHLIGLRTEGAWERSGFDPDALPFPAQLLTLSPSDFRPAPCAKQIRAAVAAWAPEAVILGDGFFMKPWVMAALDEWPLAARYYAHEGLCHKDILQFKQGRPCPENYLKSPETCRRCAAEALAPLIRRNAPLAWVESYRAAGAYKANYHPLLRKALASLTTLIVYNDAIAEQWRPWTPKVQVIPGGVDLQQFQPHPLPAEGVKRILMTGRCEDPVKGAAVLKEAARRLAAERDEVEVWATMSETESEGRYFKALGWRSHADLNTLYQQATLCAVPSLWEEPFGMVAVEAMACGRPVIASAVGGLQQIIDHQITGLLCPPGDADAWTNALRTLLDDPARCQAMGQAARARVEAHYGWDHILDHHYAPLLDALAKG